MTNLPIEPSLEALEKYKTENTDDVNFYPVYKFIPAGDIGAYEVYLKLAQLNKGDRQMSFLLESVRSIEKVDQFLFIGVGPREVIKIENDGGNPLQALEKALEGIKMAENVPGLPNFCGGAVGYISYDCVKYFEPRTARKQRDPLGLPEAIQMLFDTIVAYDHVYQRIQIITHIDLRKNKDLASGYQAAAKTLSRVADLIQNSHVDQPIQPPIQLGHVMESNIGEEGYKKHVATLKEHIQCGDIIQAVPSQRIARKTSLHPFNIYRELRTVNPSPYMFYLDFIDFQVIGASPELLCQVDKAQRVVCHPIAGTIKRGSSAKEDDMLSSVLSNSLKDRAEHIMLVDLARNDINRVCDPSTTKVDKLLAVQRFSHVQHLVSEVSGTLRPDKTRFDAFSSLFPAGTVSGAPKVKAMELIAELENEKRGVYAGAVGYWSYDGKSTDTCIALRTMVYKDGVVYIQAGGGIVFDSDEDDEYVETLNKMKANYNTIVQAEKTWAEKAGTL
ncbi:HHL121Cp [Eremothecium sinecaudum]|uniref:anthranilate synthase n=1 Tax=Eremothecium sinecaudum TaxID=45286 RepID=A0A0X8HW64_9SACH|nr:HHL121Cp [Eremothecium sinecaudum]AMD22649.1 HHL121Cp [Eremothecium sinecaudum]